MFCRIYDIVRLMNTRKMVALAIYIIAVVAVAIYCTLIAIEVNTWGGYATWVLAFMPFLLHASPWRTTLIVPLIILSLWSAWFLFSSRFAGFAVKKIILSAVKFTIITYCYIALLVALFIVVIMMSGPHGSGLLFLSVIIAPILCIAFYLLAKNMVQRYRALEANDRTARDEKLAGLLALIIIFLPAIIFILGL